MVIQPNAPQQTCIYGENYFQHFTNTSADFTTIARKSLAYVTALTLYDLVLST